MSSATQRLANASSIATSSVFHSPVVHTPQAGRDTVFAYLHAASHVLGGENFRYLREIVDGDQAMLEFQSELDGIQINGVDIIRWNDSAEVLIMNALKPADIQSITLYDDTGKAEVVVADDQLSLAIGKKGQNVRLAAKLTGWDINIVSASDASVQASANASETFEEGAQPDTGTGPAEDMPAEGGSGSTPAA